MTSAHNEQPSNLDNAQANARAVASYIDANGLNSLEIGYLLVGLSFTQAALQLRQAMEGVIGGLPWPSVITRAELLEGLAADLALLGDVDIDDHKRDHDRGPRP